MNKLQLTYIGVHSQAALGVVAPCKHDSAVGQCKCETVATTDVNDGDALQERDLLWTGALAIIPVIDATGEPLLATTPQLT